MAQIAYCLIVNSLHLEYRQKYSHITFGTLLRAFRRSHHSQWSTHANDLLERVSRRSCSSSSVSSVPSIFGSRESKGSLIIVCRDPGLIQGTIRFNICLGARSNQDVSDEQIYKALAAANIADFVRDLPNGLDTDLGGRGKKIEPCCKLN